MKKKFVGDSISSYQMTRQARSIPSRSRSKNSHSILGFDPANAVWTSGLTRRGRRFRAIEPVEKRLSPPPDKLKGEGRKSNISSVSILGATPAKGALRGGSPAPITHSRRRRGMLDREETPSGRQKKQQQSHGRINSGDEALPLKEQILQIVAILVIAAAVATVGFTVIGWISDFFKPFCTPYERGECIPCPEYGVCSEQKLQCLPGYRRQGRLCVPDSQIDRNAQKLVGFIQDFVCKQHAQALCDGFGSAWIPRDELLEITKQEMDLDEKSLSLVQSRAFNEMKNVLITRTKSGVEQLQCPSDLVEGYKPFDCWLREWIWRNILYLIALSPLVALGSSITVKLIRRRRTASRALAVYVQVCEELEDKALNADGRENVPWVVASRLRDHLLSVKERKNRRLWSEVERLVNEDSRIDQYPKLIKGESRTVWEWQAEGALRSPAIKQRVQQRVRFAKSPLQRSDVSPQRHRTAVKS